MERHPDLTRALAHARITDMLTTAARLHNTPAHPHTTRTWRRIAGTILIRLGESLLGNTQPTTNRPPLRPATATH